jgi:hypothetical protein
MGQSGKGLSDLIQEEYGVKVTFWVMVTLFGRTSATPWRSSRHRGVEIFGVPRMFPLLSAAVWIRWSGQRHRRAIFGRLAGYVAYQSRHTGRTSLAEGARSNGRTAAAL